MPAPYTPSQYKELLLAATSGFCNKFMRLFELPKMVWEDIQYRYNEDGTPSDDFCADLRAKCGCKDGIIVPPDCKEVGTTLNVQATDGTHDDKITITWAGQVEATSGFDIYRGTTPDSEAANSVGTAAAGATSFDDTTATAGIIFWYWVRGKAGTCIGKFSTPDTGYVGNPGVAGEMAWDTHGTYFWTVQTSGLHTIRCIGAGGRGGSTAPRPSLSHPCGKIYYYGGGGGGGGYAKSTGVMLNAGDVLLITVGEGGESAAGASTVSDATPTALCHATAGGPGIGGTYASPTCTPLNGESGPPGTGLVGDVLYQGDIGAAHTGGAPGAWKDSYSTANGRGGNGGQSSSIGVSNPQSGNDGKVVISW